MADGCAKLSYETLHMRARELELSARRAVVVLNRLLAEQSLDLPAIEYVVTQLVAPLNPEPTNKDWIPVVNEGEW